MTITVDLIVEAGPQTGLGHWCRQCRVADALCRQGARPRMLVAGSPPDRGMHSTTTTSVLPAMTEESLLAAMRERGTRIAVIDVPSRRLSALTGVVQATDRPTVAIVTHEADRHGAFADIVIVPEPGPAVQESFARAGTSDGLMARGAGFVVCDARPGGTRRFQPQDCRVLVTMGGADPKMLTERALAELASLEVPLSVTVTFGPFFEKSRLSRIEATLPATHTCRVVVDAARLVDLLDDTDLAVANGGLTRYELAASGVPVLLVSIDDVQARLNERLSAMGAAVHAGVLDELAPGKLGRLASDLLNDAEARSRISRRQRTLFDGSGEDNIAMVLLNAHAQRIANELE